MGDDWRAARLLPGAAPKRVAPSLHRVFDDRSIQPPQSVAGWQQDVSCGCLLFRAVQLQVNIWTNLSKNDRGSGKHATGAAFHVDFQKVGRSELTHQVVEAKRLDFESLITLAECVVSGLAILQFPH